jgi:pectinesterase
MPARRAFLAAPGLAAASSLPSQSSAGAGVVRVVVARFPAIQRAADHIPDHPPRGLSRAILEIRPGVYRERVKVPRDKVNFTFAGAYAASTTISANVSAAVAGGAFFSPVAEVNADGFQAHNIAFENTFGVGSQAVALSIHADRATFRNCHFVGWQDTLYAAWGRQSIAIATWQATSTSFSASPPPSSTAARSTAATQGYIAAVSRTTPDEPTGLIFQQCRLTAEPELKGVFLGRPWRDFARTVYVDCWMGNTFAPKAGTTGPSRRAKRPLGSPNRDRPGRARTPPRVRRGPGP